MVKSQKIRKSKTNSHVSVSRDTDSEDCVSYTGSNRQPSRCRSRASLGASPKRQPGEVFPCLSKYDRFGPISSELRLILSRCRLYGPATSLYIASQAFVAGRSLAMDAGLQAVFSSCLEVTPISGCDWLCSGCGRLRRRTESQTKAARSIGQLSSKHLPWMSCFVSDQKKESCFNMASAFRLPPDRDGYSASKRPLCNIRLCLRS